MATITSDQIHTFLTELGSQYTRPATLVLLGGGALCLLGSERPTMNIDYVGNDIRKNDLQRVIDGVAEQLQIVIDAVPIEQFIPFPPGSDNRRMLIGQFGQITVYVLDPYTIALSKLDRGFDTDIDDVVFLIRRNFIAFQQLEEVVQNALQRANEFSLDPQAIRSHLQSVQNLLVEGVG